jgi:hypothetical protein
LFVALSAVLILFVFALTAQTDFNWIGHALVGTFSLLLSLSTAVTGATLARRIKIPHGASLIGAHQKTAIYLDAFVVTSFFLGLWSRLSMGESFFWQVTQPIEVVVVVHGWFGLVVAILAVVQVIACLLMKSKKIPRRVHKFFGYPLAALLVIQTVLGIFATLA